MVALLSVPLGTLGWMHWYGDGKLGTADWWLGSGTSRDLPAEWLCDWEIQTLLEFLELYWKFWEICYGLLIWSVFYQSCFNRIHLYLGAGVK